MSDFLNALKDDLLDRRMLPFLALVAVAVVAALAYAVLGGGSSSEAPAGATASSGPASLSVSESKGNPNEALAETTNGTAEQRRGSAHDPFTPLPGTVSLTSAGTSSTATSSATTSSGSSTTPASSTTVGSKSGGAAPAEESKGETKPAAPSKPSTPSKPTTVYYVTVQFGVAPSLTPYEDLKLLTPLPSAKLPLLVFRGVTSGGKSATFTVVGEAILHGNAVCVPSSLQCQEIDLQPGQSEQLEYLAPNGTATTYELHIVSVTSATASSAAVTSIRRAESSAGRELLSEAGLVSVPGMRDSSVVGVLAFTGGTAARAGA